jgi:tetratricopeptide (TPR) repeat protein
MKKFKILGLALVATTIVAKAQDLDPAKKAIDAEQFEKAKGMLKSIIATKPSNGKASFLLGTIYLRQNVVDSAKIYFDKGLAAADGAKFNTIGQAQIDLDNKNVSAAQAKINAITAALKKKDVEEYIYAAKAYMNSDYPDYKSAIALLTKATAANPTDAQLQLTLGDAYYGEKMQNEAYVAYRNAYQTDSSLIRAKMQLGVLLKGAKAYGEAVKALNEVVSINPNYGPVYRELAETYYLWGKNEPRTYTENIQKALSFYEKYMSLTDYSLSSRMRHADFLIIAKDYKALEAEANKMKELDNVNPRILRYLGYSAYENGNVDVAIKSLKDFISNPANKIIARDYAYYGQAKIKKGTGADGKTVDPTVLAEALADIKKAIEIEPLMANELNELGKKYFSQKMFSVSSKIFELAIANPNSATFIEDNVYYGLSVYTENKSKDATTMDKVALAKADASMDTVITATPNYQEAYLYKARINSSLGKDDIMAANYQKYLDVVTAKGPEELAKNKTKVIESYNTMASFYSSTDVPKAKELLNKTLELDPANKYALDALKVLK